MPPTVRVPAARSEDTVGVSWAFGRDGGAGGAQWHINVSVAMGTRGGLDLG